MIQLPALSLITKLAGGAAVGIIAALSVALWWQMARADRLADKLSTCNAAGEAAVSGRDTSEDRRESEGEAAVEAIDDERSSCAARLADAARQCEARIARREAHVPTDQNNCPVRRPLRAGSLRDGPSVAGAGE